MILSKVISFECDFFQYLVKPFIWDTEKKMQGNISGKIFIHYLQLTPFRLLQ